MKGYEFQRKSCDHSSQSPRNWKMARATGSAGAVIGDRMMSIHMHDHYQQ